MGLLRGVARTAVVAGTATAVSNRVSRRQANRWAGQQEAAPPPQETYAAPPQQAYAAPPPPAPAASEDVIAQLERLGKLRDDGVLTDAEFSAQKARLLAG
ncbi:SHOCT domain-containing protein [Promicromonospora sp. NPDC090134]|uniref:SHOCT domain-containing protein n=1 Tax=Promicromonospora sp. NPDC090134 TaxID=3364408 RepID=UPI0038195FD5